MSHRAFTKIYLHCVWHTLENLPLITPESQELLYSTIKKRCANDQVALLGLGGIENHVHLAIRIPPTISIAQWIGKLKGGGSFEVNQTLPASKLLWENGYGIVSFREKELNIILEYIDNQATHHRSGNLIDNLEKSVED
jgi:putative transposase